MKHAKFLAVATSIVIGSLYLFATVAVSKQSTDLPSCVGCVETARVHRERLGSMSCPIYAPDPDLHFDCVKYKCGLRYSWNEEPQGTVCQFGTPNDPLCTPDRTCVFTNMGGS